eukprot:2045245-Pleurochrysis_carterae.AAC.1
MQSVRQVREFARALAQAHAGAACACVRARSSRSSGGSEAAASSAPCSVDFVDFGSCALTNPMNLAMSASACAALSSRSEPRLRSGVGRDSPEMRHKHALTHTSTHTHRHTYTHA